MAQDNFNPKLGRIRDARRARAQRHTALVFRQAGKHGSRALRQRGHISPATPKRGMRAGARAAAVPGVYDRAITTPTVKVAVIRRQDTFTLAPWKPALEPFKGE
jgi:hypothetical protein